ncbi:hypothetical protein [Candidatus Flexifilum breve]
MAQSTADAFEPLQAEIAANSHCGGYGLAKSPAYTFAGKPRA